MLVIFILFIISLYLFLYFIFIFVFEFRDYFKFNIYFSIIIFGLLNFCAYNEVFYWFIGSVYVWMVTFCMFTCSLILLLFRKSQSNFMLCLTSIVGFISCFAYQIDIFVGIFYLIEYYVFSKRHKNK